VPQTTIANQTFTWSRGLILNHTFVTGLNLITKYQRIYSPGTLLDSGVVTGDGGLTLDASYFSDGVVTGDHILTSYGVVTGDGTLFLAVNALFQDLLSEGSFLSDGVVTGDDVVTGDGVVTGDLVANAQSAMLSGDFSSLLTLALDDGIDCLDY
jgi:hypothetical protein